MLSMTDCKFGDVVLVGFPFTNLQTAKKRPAVIISNAVYQQQRPALAAVKERFSNISEALRTRWHRVSIMEKQA